MGFAGQVFAARVAIGLAVPSPKALNKTGSLLAQGIKAMHNRIKLASKSADLTGEYKKNVAKLNQTARTSAERTSTYITQKLQQNLDKMSKQSIKNTRRVFKRTSQEYKDLTKEMNKPFAQRNLGSFETATGMRTMQEMAVRMSRMNKMERQEQIRHQNGILLNAQRLVTKERERQKAVNDIKTITTKEADKQRRNLEKLKEVVDKEKQRLRVLQQIDGEMHGINQEMDEMNDEGAEWGAQITGVTNTLRTNFNDALRNTVAIMTALGFQVHRATTSLMEFERELINANSVFNLTHDELFTVGNEIMKFGNQYGIAVQNGAEGMYQLASAGLSANEAMEVLPHTLKLSMAVQGDHNTISKLTAQTIFGFGMEMEQASEVTDKFAFAIQKSLIEYQDLASAVKFALPFFTSTGQSIDQLLGALQILTNRALEAGIAGRGLRQALAEFAESAMDAEVGFRKMGVEILNAEGEMMQLTEIAAQFAAAVGPETASNTELLTTLIEDLNVRGATAFIHLVQASDEFTQAVEDTENAGGQLDAMIEEQNKSLSAQVQILKTNVLSIFAFRDAAYEGTGYLNAFHESVVETITGFRGLFVEGEGAEQKLTELGQAIQDQAVVGVEKFNEIAEKMTEMLKKLAEDSDGWSETIKLLVMPLEILAGIVEFMAGTKVGGSSLLELYLKFKLINSIIPVTTAFVWGLSAAWKSVAMYQLAAMAGGGGLGGAGLSAGAQMSTAYAAQKGTKGALGWNAFQKANKGKFVSGVAPMIGRAAPWLTKGAMVGMAGSLAVPLGVGLTAAWAYNKFAKEKAAGGYLTPMAQGGFPSGGSPYLVGEQGPELFVPESAGQLLNNGATQNSIGSGMVMKNVTIGIDSFGGIV
jgi:TP901 family phage tail tape measure protein